MLKRPVVLIVAACVLLVMHVTVNLLGLVPWTHNSPSVQTRISQIGGRFDTDDAGNITSVTLAEIDLATNLSFVSAIRPHLKELTLRKTHAGDSRIMERLGRLPELRSLRMIDCSYSASIANEDFPNLRELTISECEIDDAVFDNLGSLKLKCLKVSHTNVSDSALEFIGYMSSLEELLLSSNPELTDRGITQLAKLYSLRMLHLFRSNVTGSAFAEFDGDYALEHLDISNTPFSSEAFEHLRAFPQLTFLNASNTLLMDSGMTTISSMKNLKLLAISDTNVSDDGVANVKTLSNLSEINLAGTKVTDAGLTQLEELLSLSTVTLTLGNGVTVDGIDHLMSENPKMCVRSYSQ